MMSVNTTLRRIFSTPHYHQSTIRSLCSAIVSSKDTKQTSPDILMNKFKYASSTNEVLETFSQHKDVMNSKHIMQALRAVFTLQKEGRSEMSTKNIIASHNFQQLCDKLKKLAGTIDSHETIDALKVVTYVGVPKKSTIVLVLLQLLKHSVNDLNLQQIMFLDFLLTQYSEVPLAQALKIALPIVFDIQLPLKMEKGSINNLKEYLYYASTHNLSDKSVDLILSELMKCREKYGARIAKSVVWSLTEMQPRPCFEELLEKNLRILSEVAEDLSFNELDVTLKKLAYCYTKFLLPFYRNEEFCNSVVGYLLDRNIELDVAIYTMKKLEQLDVINKSLIDYISNKMSSSEGGFENFYNNYVILKYLAKTDYRPPNWNELLEKIKNTEKLKMQNIEIRKLALALSYHQIFEKEMIEELFNQDFKELFARKNVINPYLALYHSIKLYKPELVPVNFKPEEFLNYIEGSREFPLEGALFSAFGGEKYVKSGIYSKEGIFIDHVIIFRKGGYPVSTNFTETFLEDLDVPQDNEIVLVMCLRPEAYTEGQYLKKAYSFRVQLLEKLGYTVVPVCLENWKNLMDFEKIPYLVQNIKNKFRQDVQVDSYA